MPPSKPPPRQKSPTSIEVWRHEVSESALPPSSPSSPSPSPELKRQPSFWKKILPSRSRSSTTVEPHVQINGHAVQEGGPGKHHTNKRKGSDTPEPGVRTAMYNKAYSNRSRLKDMSNPQNVRDEDLLGVEDEEDGRGGSSMEIASGDSDEVGGLKDKLERLERAKRLLEGKGRGMPVMLGEEMGEVCESGYQGVTVARSGLFKIETASLLRYHLGTCN